MDLLEINLINVAFMAANFFLEIPTGAIADNWGRKRSTQIGIIFLGLSFLTYYLAGSFVGYILAEIIGAIGATCISGALEAWYVDGQKVFGEHEHMDKTFAKEQQWKQFAVIIGSVAGAQIGQISLDLPWLMAFVTSVLVLIIVSIVMTNDNGSRPSSQKISFEPIIKTAKESIEYGWKNNEVMKLIGLGFIFTASMMALNMQWPIMFKSYGWEVKNLGWLFAVIAITNSLGGRLAPYFKKNTDKEFNALVFSQLITVFGIIGSGLMLGPKITFTLFMIHQAGRGMFWPLRQGMLNREIDSQNRATVLSFASMISNSGAVFGLIISGLIAKYYSIGISWISSGIFLTLGFAVILFHHHKKTTI